MRLTTPGRALPQASKAALQGGASHRVDDHIGTTPAGEPAHLFDEIGRCIVDPVVQAQWAQAGQFLVARGRGQHPGSSPARQLDGGDAHTTSPRMHEDGLS